MFGRKQPPRTQSQQLLDELAESYEHLRQAAGHAAGGAAEKVTPTYDRARNAASRGWSTTRDAFSPLYEQMRVGAANARGEYEVQKKNRWPMLIGFLAAGAAAGAAGAMVARRRRAAAQWDDYDPMASVDELPYGSDRPTATKKVTAGAASVAESVSSQASKLADSLHEKSGGARTGSMPSMTDKPAAGAEKASGKAGEAADKASSKASDHDRP